MPRPSPARVSRPSYALPVPAPVGAVVAAFDADNTLRHYAVLADGLQPISPVVAAILRNTNSYGLDQPPRLGADDVARLPVASAIDVGAYPREPVTLVDAADAPLTCAQWTQPGRRDRRHARTAAPARHCRCPTGCARSTWSERASGTTADRVVAGAGHRLPRADRRPGRRTVVDPAGCGPMFWLSDTGVRYGIDTDGDAEDRCGARTHPAAAANSVVDAEPVRGGADAVARRRAAGPRRARSRPAPAQS